MKAIINASEVVTAHAVKPKSGHELSDLGIVRDGAVVYEDDLIIEVGGSNELMRKYQPDSVIDARGRVVMPGFVDAHTHLVHM
ncbi:amidohydrolase family protein, partial [Acinetobacter baumannii]